ncbi:ABC transporter permease subunit [Rhodobacter sphaeroides]|jgi:ABC-type spermidine/putrescine transport system, permease component II|uniref:ABC transporter, inner membrane subunit n=2 Tax=Cereibacter sphaeroides TaxID=1063 RepID=Q3J4H5_CERS4|nr:ABC transporter permease [Cereibacter sphaeroides]ABA78309.1 ABC transporter, inner membrane subunit [Cereibacter sphaeroides 2.4.1]ACM00327.1 Binding-protein-dependent transport systems inner membrane component precursor [Cereibacter sphaeroides KD131]AMJ46663.1 ABC transporter permease [Cereibacter sphaeroides]ANS33376.1 ABC transporter permease [Cereibacter sphaeroides]ATN62419.1 ABC transporter permease [Cereibacter sphaeroides]
MTTAGQRLAIWSLVWISILILSAPTVVVLGASVTSGNMIAFPPEGFSLKWYEKIAMARDLRQAFGRSLVVATVCTLVALPVGTLAGIALSRYRLRFANALQVYLLLPFTVPLIGSGIGLMLVFGEWRVLGSLWPVGVACAVINLPFLVWSVSSSATLLDPDLEHAAANCGAGRVQTFLHVTLPAVMPGVITGSLLMFILAMNEFLVSLLLTDARTVTLPVQIYNSIRSIITPDLAAVSVVFIVIAGAAIAVLDRLVGLEIFLKSK